MGTGRRRLSFTEQKLKRRRFLRNLLVLILILASYGTLKGFFLAPYRIGSASMEPGLEIGDRVLATPIVLGAMNPFTARNLPGFREARRGELVLVDHPAVKRARGLALVANGVIRFFTFQLVGSGGRNSEEPVVKRVIGVPGDRVSLKGFKASVRPRGEEHAFSEEELAVKPYDLVVPSLPQGWASDLPFSGDMEELELGPGEYFVLSDDRGVFHDSRSWGALDSGAIRALVLVRYWPILKR